MSEVTEPHFSLNYGKPVVGTLFIDTADIYCLGTGLPISIAKDLYQYRHIK